MVESSGLCQAAYLSNHDGAFYLFEQVDELERALLPDCPTSLIATIYVSPNQVFPKRSLTLALGAISRQMLGLLIAVSRKGWRAWQAESINANG